MNIKASSLGVRLQYQELVPVRPFFYAFSLRNNYEIMSNKSLEAISQSSSKAAQQANSKDKECHFALSFHVLFRHERFHFRQPIEGLAVNESGGSPPRANTD